MKSDQISINLLKSQDKDFLTRFFEWALVGGRFIVIVTESIALMMFLYRFSLDRTLVDLHDEIKQNQAVLNGFKTSEANFRDIQERLALAQQYNGKSAHALDIVTHVVDEARGRVTFQTFQLTEKNLKLSVTSPSVRTINDFISRVQALSIVQSVQIETIESKPSNGTISISMTVLLKS